MADEELTATPARPNALQLLMSSSARRNKFISKPCGPVPAGKEWDGWKGKWVASGPVDSGPANDVDDDADDDGAQPQRKRRYRVYQETWLGVLPTLVCVSTCAPGSICPGPEKEIQPHGAHQIKASKLHE